MVVGLAAVPDGGVILFGKNINTDFWGFGMTEDE